MFSSNENHPECNSVMLLDGLLLHHLFFGMNIISSHRTHWLQPTHQCIMCVDWIDRSSMGQESYLWDGHWTGVKIHFHVIFWSGSQNWGCVGSPSTVDRLMCLQGPTRPVTAVRLVRRPAEDKNHQYKVSLVGWEGVC